MSVATQGRGCFRFNENRFKGRAGTMAAAAPFPTARDYPHEQGSRSPGQRTGHHRASGRANLRQELIDLGAEGFRLL